MRPPKFVREVTAEERVALEAGLRSSDAFVLRRCQTVLASARGERAPQIAAGLGCDDQTVLTASAAFNARGARGLACLVRGSPRAHRTSPAFPPARAEALRALLHQSPRTFGTPSRLWTLELAADVSFEQGLAETRVTGETIRATLVRLGVKWQRAKDWITSPDPEYARKKAPATA